MAEQSAKLHPTEKFIRTLIRIGQSTPFAERGNWQTGSGDGRESVASFPEATAEAQRFGDFFAFFDEALRSEITNSDILDLGSGYGGRTVEYRRTARANSVIGVEVFDSLVKKSAAFANAEGVDSVEFRLATQAEIPCKSNAFDVVLSYDVLEHVEDPRDTLSEIRRVLRPGGTAYLVFPSYLGAFSHHLDYITLLPGLHWFFDPDRIIGAVNSLLGEEPERYGTALQPPSRDAFDGSRRVLPTLNGLTGQSFKRIVEPSGLELDSFRYVPIAERLGRLRVLAMPVNRLLMALGRTSREAFSLSCAAVLRKSREH